MTYPEVLNAVKELLAPTAWVKYNAAQNDQGLPVTVSSPSAVTFCLAGGVDRILGPMEDRLLDWDRGPEGQIFGYLSSAIDLLDFAPRVLRDFEDEDTYFDPGVRVVRFNDNNYTTYEDVVAVIDKAIELASA